MFNGYYDDAILVSASYAGAAVPSLQESDWTVEAVESGPGG